MKIEKVNDHQIRCTLTKNDLADRELKISELAYGTDKAKDLFRDMMQQAAYQFGFEAEDIPLMIEAIPLSGDCIVLIITKVEDPEELDTRFSKFAPSLHEDEEPQAEESDELTGVIPSGADDVLDLFHRLKESSKEATETASDEAEPELTIPVNLTKMFSFSDIDEVSRLAHVLRGYYNGENSLYKQKDNGAFYLVLRKSDHTPEEFNKICNIISEYAHVERYTPASEAYLSEHADLLIADSALQKLTRIELK